MARGHRVAHRERLQHRAQQADLQRGELARALLELGHAGGERGLVDRLFGRVVQVDGPLGDPGLARDGLHRGLLEAVAAEHAARRIHKRGTPVGVQDVFFGGAGGHPTGPTFIRLTEQSL